MGFWDRGGLAAVFVISVAVGGCTSTSDETSGGAQGIEESGDRSPSRGREEQAQPDERTPEQGRGCAEEREPSGNVPPQGGYGQAGYGPPQGGYGQAGYGPPQGGYGPMGGPAMGGGYMPVGAGVPPGGTRTFTSCDALGNCLRREEWMIAGPFGFSSGQSTSQSSQLGFAQTCGPYGCIGF